MQKAVVCVAVVLLASSGYGHGDVPDRVTHMAVTETIGPAWDYPIRPVSFTTVQIDDEPWPPGLHGTGAEDYFGMAWGVHRPYQAFDHGVSHYERNLTDHDRFYDGRFVLYRWHLTDPIPFERSLHASIEAGYGNECAQHYESAAFWYAVKTP